MRPVEILLDPDRLVRWHGWVVEAIAAHGPCELRVDFSRQPRRIILPGLAWLLRLERRAGRVRRETALDPMSPADPVFARWTAPGQSHSWTDGVQSVDLRGAPAATGLHPLYDGSAGEAALWSALLAGRAPAIAIGGLPPGGTECMALPAIEDTANLHAASTMVLARVAEAIGLAVHALCDPEHAEPLGRCADEPPSSGRPGSTARFLSRVVAAKVRARLERRAGRVPRWAVAWRRAPDGRTHPPRALDVSEFTLLDDDGQRYYADPFLYAHKGRVHLFVEEVPDATGRGIISHAVLGTDGRFPTPRPVLERPYHLSYPQVFAHAGQIWMMPETSASGGIELYRAERFPDRFVLHQRLVEGSYHDATFFEHAGRLWIAAGNQIRGSSSWDGLSLFHATHIEGPWTPHPLNPVRIDRRAARPAGSVYVLDGTLYRPSQDCSNGYGSALTLSRFTPTLTAYTETRVAHVAVAGAPHVLGPHTINWAGGIEVIDLFAPPAWRPDRS